MYYFVLRLGFETDEFSVFMFALAQDHNSSFLAEAGDGRDELFTTGAGDSYTILSAGTEGERGVRFDEYAGQLPWDGAAADINGDGLPEIAFANQAARRVSLIFSAAPFVTFKFLDFPAMKVC